MSETRTIPWGRILVEAVAIVASILLAFAIDAWWDDRGQREDLRLELANVMSELEENRGRVELEVAILDRIILAGSTLIDAMASDENAVLVRVPDYVAFLSVVWSPTLDPSFGAVDALVTSGRLAQVKNPVLRSGLAGIRAQFDDALEEELNARVIQNTLVFPLLSDKVDLRPLNEYDAKYFETIKYSVAKPPSDGDFDFPNSLAIRNTIGERMGWLLSGRREMDDLLISIDNLLKLLRAQAE